MSTKGASMGEMGAMVTPPAAPATLFFDGALDVKSRSTGIGFVLRDGNGREIKRFAGFLGFNLTNNVAEYKALIAGLQHAVNNGITNIVAYGGSQTVCNLVNGQYQVGDGRLRRYYDTVLELQRRFQMCRVVHQPREHNNVAHALANHGIVNKPVDDRTDQVIERCTSPRDAIKYVLEKRCEGFYQLCFILHIMQHHAPLCYTAVEGRCREIAMEIGTPILNMCKPCLLVEY